MLSLIVFSVPITVRVVSSILKINFQPLNEAQLYHLVCGYDHGGKQPPSSWLPSPEDRHQANMKGISKGSIQYSQNQLGSTMPEG
jgi:hypothetical protein